MVRVALSAILMTAAVSALGACGKADAPAAQPGAVAGKVLEVSGAVNVANHPLAVGDTVKTDDSVDTGADGHVVIELAHNLARWELGPNHKMKPTDSLAWTVAKKTGGAAQVDQDTSAAGRQAERSAADSNASAAKGGNPTVDRERAPAVAAEPAPPPPPAAQPAPPSAAPPSAAPPPPAPPQATSRAAKIEPPISAAPGGGPGAGGGGRSEPEKARPLGEEMSIETLKATLTSCLAGSSVHLKAHVASYLATITFVGAVDAKVKQCITTTAKTLRLNTETADLDFTLTK